MKSLAVAVVSAYLFTGGDPQAMMDTQYKAYATVQAFNPGGVEKYRNKILDSSKRMPKSAQAFLDNNIDWEVYAESIFRPNWDKLTKAQQVKFKKLLQRNAVDRYGHLFSPSTKFTVHFNGGTQYKVLRGHRFAKVSTTISALRSDAEIDADFIFHRGPGRWALCDVYIDGVSKSKTYRREVRRIYRKEGYDGVIKAFRKKR